MLLKQNKNTEMLLFHMISTQTLSKKNKKQNNNKKHTPKTTNKNITTKKQQPPPPPPPPPNKQNPQTNPNNTRTNLKQLNKQRKQNDLTTQCWTSQQW